jgi:hypothetical protein
MKLDYRFDQARGLFLPGQPKWAARFEGASPAFIHSDGTPRIGGGSVSAAYRLVSGTPFAAATGAKTFMMAIAPAGHGLALTEISVSADGVTSSAVPMLLEIVTSTQATAGTSGVTPTITQVRGRATTGQAPTGGGNYTAEPTALVSVSRWYIPQFMGTFVYQFPLGREIECDSSGGTIKALGIRINVSATVNVVGHMEVEAVG